MGKGLTRHEMNRTSHMMQWLPDRLKSRIVGGNWRQLIANFKLGMSANLLTRQGHDSGLPDLAERRAWSELVLRTAGMVGPQSTIMVALLGEIGVKDNDELRELVESGRRMRQLRDDASISHEAMRDNALELLRDLIRLHPEWRDGVLEMLGAVSHATVLESENGSTKGDGAPHVNGDV